MEPIITFFTGASWWHYVLRSIVYFFLAWIIHQVGKLLSKYIVRLGKFAANRINTHVERMVTLRELVGGIIGGIAYLVAFLLSLAQIVDVSTIVWLVGLFSAAFGLAARPLISDFMTGVGFLFEDTFTVGEKVELLGMEGVIEAVNLRSTLLRSPSGELYIIPNGEIRVVRNFSRGRFSVSNITLKIPTSQASQALDLLNKLGLEAVSLLPDMLESWKVINETGQVGEHITLTLLSKARFGQAAEMRPRLLSLVHERLAEAGIQTVD